MQHLLHSLINKFQHFFLARSGGHGIHSPIAYDLCRWLDQTRKRANEECQQLRLLRSELKRDTRILKDAGFGSGSRFFKKPYRRLNQLVSVGISTHFKARILYQLIQYFKPAEVLELGTSIGVTTLYLATAQFPNKVYTVEGNKDYLDVASSLFNRFREGACVVPTLNTFDAALITFNTMPEWVFVDGSHDYKNTLSIFNAIQNCKNTHQVIVFDDIYWSKEMTRAWSYIVCHSKNALILDAFHFGIVIQHPNLKCGYSYKIKLR